MLCIFYRNKRGNKLKIQSFSLTSLISSVQYINMSLAVRASESTGVHHSHHCRKFHWSVLPGAPPRPPRTFLSLLYLLILCRPAQLRRIACSFHLTICKALSHPLSPSQ